MSYIKTIITMKNGSKIEGPFMNFFYNIDETLSEILDIEQSEIEDIKWKVEGESHKGKKQLGVVSILKNKKILDSRFPFIPETYNVDRQREWNKQFMFKSKNVNHLIKLYDVGRFYNRYDAGVHFPINLMKALTSDHIYSSKRSFRVAMETVGLEKVTSISQIYNFFTIRTKKGKVRLVCSNKNPQLKEASKMIKDILMYVCNIDDSMLGLGKGINKSVDYLENSEFIVKIDLKDFFNSTSYQLLKKGLEKQGFEENLAKSVGLSCTPPLRYEDDNIRHYLYPEKQKLVINSRRTWQGLETSSIASYIAFMPIYQKILNYCKNKGATPVLYVDDLAIKVPKKNRALAEEIKSSVIKIIEGNSKLKTNTKKSKLLYGNKKFYCNINTDLKQLPNDYVKNLKAVINTFFHKGFVIDGNKSYTADGTLCKQIIAGKLNYMKMISEEQYNRIINHWKYGEMLKSKGVI